MIFQIINGMARLSVILHTASILTYSPKGEGFSPIPEWDNNLYPYLLLEQEVIHIVEAKLVTEEL